MPIGGMNQPDGFGDPHETRNPRPIRVLLHGKAQMIQARSTASQIAVVDVTTARIEDSAAQRGALAGLPDGYDRTDLRVLEWIAASRRPSRVKLAELAA
jgi:hypothetical protein